MNAKIVSDLEGVVAGIVKAPVLLVEIAIELVRVPATATEIDVVIGPAQKVPD